MAFAIGVLLVWQFVLVVVCDVEVWVGLQCGFVLVLLRLYGLGL